LSFEPHRSKAAKLILILASILQRKVMRVLETTELRAGNEIQSRSASTDDRNTTFHGVTLTDAVLTVVIKQDL
jgi:hypothetical protein